jgi:hypothetical protein
LPPTLFISAVNTGFSGSECVPSLKSVWNSRRPSTHGCALPGAMLVASCMKRLSGSFE